MIDNYTINFSDVNVQKTSIKSWKTVPQNEISTSDIIVVIQVG